MNPGPVPSPARALALAARPRTLGASLVPVLVGSALAASLGRHAWSVTAVCALAALLLQVGANLANDALDHRAGVDDGDRLGPPRATQQGWLSYAQVAAAAAVTLALALLSGIWLVRIGGLPILVTGLVSIAAAVAYSAGPWPLSRHGLGELAAFVFFGLVAVGGSAYLQLDSLPAGVLIAAVPIGALVSCIMLVNNLRDIASDARAGKRTLAVRLGPERTRALFALALGVAAVWPGVTALLLPQARLAVLAWIALPLMPALARRLGRARSGPEFNRCLVDTARLHAVYGALYGLGIAL